MCTLPQGATNWVAHMMNGMHNVFQDFIPHINEFVEMFAGRAIYSGYDQFQLAVGSRDITSIWDYLECVPYIKVRPTGLHK